MANQNDRTNKQDQREGTGQQNRRGAQNKKRNNQNQGNNDNQQTETGVAEESSEGALDEDNRVAIDNQIGRSERRSLRFQRAAFQKATRAPTHIGATCGCHLRRDRQASRSQYDPHVNLSYYKDRTREWISVSNATVTRDRRRPVSCQRQIGRCGFRTGGSAGTPDIHAWCDRRRCSTCGVPGGG